MLRIKEVSSNETPRFLQLISSNHQPDGLKASAVKEIIKDVLNISAQRGLNDIECSALLKFVKGSSLGTNIKLKILQNIFPQKKMTKDVIRPFIVWFMSSLHKDNINNTAACHIFQWIIGLLEYQLIDSGEIYIFYHDLFVMLGNPSLVPYVAKLLCKLTKPHNVIGSTVRNVQCRANDNPRNKYLLAILTVFKGYKPHLMLKEVKQVDVPKVLNSVPQTMDTIMSVKLISSLPPRMPMKAPGVYEKGTRNFACFREESMKVSSLIPLPSYNFEGLDKFRACYPNSVKEAFKNFSRVPIPQRALSLLHNETGFFTLMYQPIEEQMRFQNNLFQTLQNVLIYKEIKTASEDIEILLRRTFSLETYMQQGIPSVSIFLSGYLLNWDGVDHRYSILQLIEWAVYSSFRHLGANILQALYVHFITNNINMKKAIIETLTNLIKNMFCDVSRVQRRIPFPFLKRAPKWTEEPRAMLEPLISWTQKLITLGLSAERDCSALLLKAIDFYEMISALEADSKLQMFTVVTEGVLLQSLLSQNPVVILRICSLLLKYHRDFLPRLRKEQPQFYEQCKEKIGLTSYYAQQIIYFLQNGEVVLPRKEKGMNIREIPNETIASGRETFNLTQHMAFASTFVPFECEKNSLDILEDAGRRTCLELAGVHVRKIKEFINFFSPSSDPEPLA